MRPVVVLPLAVFAALAAVLAVYLWQVGPGGKRITELPSAMIDKPAPEFDLKPLPGANLPGIGTADLKGQVILINFFASWCVPCRVEHPVLMRLAKEGVRIWGISYKDKPEDALRFLAEGGTPYERIGVDEGGRTFIDFGAYGVPETFIIDAEGRIRYREAGPISPAPVEEKFRAALKRVTK
jgi:cytochrome c biogenesis protein CcmG, thiol:disulfide interchange protein DsbE